MDMDASLVDLRVELAAAAEAVDLDLHAPV
jgi:hypothetical protein